MVDPHSRKHRHAWLRVVLAATLVFSLLSVLSTRTAVADAGPLITFEDYTVGTVHTQHGWQSEGPAGVSGVDYDHEVATQALYPSFGSKALRISNAFTSLGFSDQTYSRELINEAGETDADNVGLSGGVRQPYFTADWDFASAVPGSQQPGLAVSISPTHGLAMRMSWVQILDDPAGLTVKFNDVQSGAFVETTIATALDRTVPHHLRMTIHFVDGVDNDVVQVFLDGTLIHTGTSWEGYYPIATPPAVTGTVDSIMFNTRGTAAPATQGNGFYFDNVRLTSSGVPSDAGTVVVHASGEQTWLTQADSTASVDFVDGPGTPPLGVGSVRMQTGSDGDSNGRLRSTSLAGTPLSNLSALSYQTYVSANDSCQAPFLILDVDTTGDGAGDDLLFFEPCYQTGTYGGANVPNQGDVTLNTWQTWDALVGGWWSLNAATFGPPLTTLSAYMLANPTAVIANSPNGSTRFQIGNGGALWANFVGHVDAVTFGVNGTSTTYDFDVVPVVPDTSGPVTSKVKMTPRLVYAPATGTLTATVSDANTGGSTISSASYSINGGAPVAMTATDGVFNEVTEPVKATINGMEAGSYTICVRGVDSAANTGADVCTNLTLHVLDNQAPQITSLTTQFDPVRVNHWTALTAVVDDTTTGNSSIRAAEYRINNTGSWSALYAADGAWNSPVESVSRNIQFSTPGVYEICVRARDTSNNVSSVACITQVVVDPSGGRLQASGQYTAPKKAIFQTPAYSGRATFSLTAGYANSSAAAPQGAFTLTHAGNTLRFQSSSLDWLIVNGSSGVVRGTGALNGVAGYTFEVSFKDNGSGTSDVLRVRIWHAATTTQVYDTQPGKPVSAAPTLKLYSGNISILP